MVEDWTSFISKDEDQIKNIIARDVGDKFFTFLKESLVINSGDLVRLKFGESELCPYKLLACICRHRAIHCGTELVKAGKMGLELDLNIPINRGAFPLHEAASSLSSSLIELFLHHGAQADVRCNSGDSEHDGLLPLHTALERLSSLTQWTHRNSVYKLIIILCLPQMKEALVTNRLLALNTKEIKDVIRCYAKDGKVIELAVLLMVAREKVMDPITFEGIDRFTSTGYMTLPECIHIELAALINYEYKLMGRKEDKRLARICKNLKVSMISMLQLLEIFESAGDAIETYLQLERTNAPKEQIAQEVTGLLREAGFILKSRVYDLSKIVDCCPAKLVPFEEEKGQSVFPSTEEPVQYGSNQSDVSAVFSRPNKKPTCGLPNDNWRLFHIRFSGGPSALSPSSRPLHIFWNGRANFCSGFPKTMGSQVKERLKGEGQYVRKFSPSKQWPYFVLVVKKGIRCG